ncbi:MAG: hypothetical protein ACK5T6_05680, partial [Pirellula sp.]
CSMRAGRISVSKRLDSEEIIGDEELSSEAVADWPKESCIVLETTRNDKANRTALLKLGCQKLEVGRDGMSRFLLLYSKSPRARLQPSMRLGTPQFEETL